MAMTVDEMRDYLDGMDGDTEIRFAAQPRWAFEYEIAAVEEVESKEAATGTVIYLVEGTQLGYLPGPVAEAIGWEE